MERPFDVITFDCYGTLIAPFVTSASRSTCW